jgi:hypothetical protein
MDGQKPIVVRPVLEMRLPAVTRTLTPSYTIYPDGRVEQERVKLPGGMYQLMVARIVVPGGSEGGDTPAVKLNLAPLQPVDMVMLEVTTKPGIDLVWLGGYLMLFGAFLAFRRRATVARRERPIAVLTAPEPAAVDAPATEEPVVAGR